MKKYITALSIMTTTLLFGCSNIDNYEKNINSFIADQNLTPMESVESVETTDFIPLNNQHIALVTQNGKSYLLTTPDDCQNMLFANKIVLASTDNGVVQVNSNKIVQAEDKTVRVGDKVVRFGDKYTECAITGIYKLYSVHLGQLVYWSHEQYPLRTNESKNSLRFTEAKSRGL